LRAQDEEGAEAASQLEAGVLTQLGGAFYIINLMGYLDLPACFEETWGLASQVGAWGVLEALIRSLLAGKGDRVAGDPLWEALAGLDGRESGELPGEGFQGGDTFRLPTAWLTQVDGSQMDVWFWATRSGRLCLWSEQGYVLADRPIPEGALATEELARDELRACQTDVELPRLCRRSIDRTPTEHLTSPLVSGLNPHLVGWLAMTLPYIRFRLRQALRSDKAPDGALDPEQVVLLVPGRLAITATHVDLVMRLDDISLPVRLAGLDRDPGWVADFGRVVRFHFE
jgi:hypothetical protein